MSTDEDEDNFTIYGDALEDIDEGNLPRKKPIRIEDQVAKDEHGRRRFHGAFTGGFTAGFLNTTGSLEGWTPSNFVSSRDNKVQYKHQTIHDFMDDEDKGEFGICPMTVKIKPSFDDSINSKASKRDKYEIPSKTAPISGILNVRDILKPIKETVGLKLLMTMGWKPGQGVGPRLTKKEKLIKKRVYGCTLSRESHSDDDDEDFNKNSEDPIHLDYLTFAPDEYSICIPKPKNDTFGLGYVGISRDSVLSSKKHKYSRLTLEGKSIHGQAFGVGAYEEDDEDIYAADDMSQYDFSLGPTTANNKLVNKNKLSTLNSDCIDGFHVVSEQYGCKETFPVIKVPEDFVPFHRVKKSRFNDAEHSSNKRICKLTSNIEERSLLLGNVSTLAGKEPLVVKTSDGCETQNLNLSVKTEDNGTDICDKHVMIKNSSNSFKPFSFDPEKQKRYEKFLSMVKSNNKELLPSIQPITMTDWERVREKLEFEKAAKLFTSVSSDLSARFTGGNLLDDVATEKQPSCPKLDEDDDTKIRKQAAEKEMYGFLTRRKYKFVPCKLLCQRFNVPEPVNRDDLEFCPDTLRKSKHQTKGIFSILESDMFSEPNCQSSNVKSEDVIDTPVSSNADAEKNSEMEVDIIPVSDNRMDLFKAIFLDSSDDDGSEEKIKSDKRQNETIETISGHVENPIDSKDYAKKIVQDILRPASGIFANLDLDALKGNHTFRQTTNEAQIPQSTREETDRNGDPSVNNDDGKECVTRANNSGNNRTTESYGPILPDMSAGSVAFKANIDKKLLSDNVESSDTEGLWVEKSTKHKHRYKKKKKHKKDKKKRK